MMAGINRVKSHVAIMARLAVQPIKSMATRQAFKQGLRGNMGNIKFTDAKLKAVRALEARAKMQEVVDMCREASRSCSRKDGAETTKGNIAGLGVAQQHGCVIDGPLGVEGSGATEIEASCKKGGLDLRSMAYA